MNNLLNNKLSIMKKIVLLLITGLLLYSCTPQENPDPNKTKPTVTTGQITGITTTTATCSDNNVTADGGAAVTARGICWSMSPQPTASLGTRTQDGTGSGSFTSTINGLASRSKYYVRAYATNATGTAYGQEITLQTPASCSLSKTTLTLMPEGGSNNTITVTAYLSWTAEIIGNGDWLTLNTLSGNAGASQLSINLQPNTTSQDRNITIRISCQDMHLDLLITQLRVGGYIDDGDLL